MGLSSSLLDENKLNFIKSWAQTELRNFASIYKKQYSLAFLSHVHDELVQRKQEHTQLLKQRDPPQEADVVYQETVLYFCLNRKWKKRFVVVRASYTLECHESYETFMKGIPPLNTLSTTGGAILTTEEKYMEMVDRCFPETNNVKEDFAPPVVGMPGQFPVYLRLPYQRDYYFCFLQEAKQATFISVLSDCIRHQNQDFLKKKTYEIQAFSKAVQLHRQEKGYYEAWDMLIGNDVQVLTNLTMEELIPALEKDLFAHLKAKKMDKKKLWFATVEAVYTLVQETLTEGMAALNDECREASTQQSSLMRSDMDQIMSSRAFLKSKLRDTVAELATEYCEQHIEPRLPAVLEETMGPISLGFAEARQVSEGMLEHLCEKYQAGLTREELQQALVEMSKPNLQSCYEKVSGLKDHIHEFSYPNCRGLEHSTQIDIQQLVDSASYTFRLLLNKSSQDDTNLLDAMIKAKQRVLKQYVYDSSTLRKKIFQEALLSITLPSVKAFLAPTFRKELPDFQQYIFDDYVNFVNVENVYEDILQEILERDISKVVKEAASMKKYDLHVESRYRFSVSSRCLTPPDSPDYTSSFTTVASALPSSPLLSHSLTENHCTGEGPGRAKKRVEQEVFIDPQEAVQEQVCPSEDTMGEQQVIMAQQDDVQAQAQPEIIRASDVEDLVSAEKKVASDIIIQTHEQPKLIKLPASKDPGMAERKMEPEVILQAQAQPEFIKMSPSEDPIVAEKKVEQEIIIQAQAQPKLIKVAADEDPRMDKKKGDLEVIVQPQAQPEPFKISPGEDKIVTEKTVEQKVILVQQVEFQAQPDLINGCPSENTRGVEQEFFNQVLAESDLDVSTSVKVEKEHKVEDNGLQSVPVTVPTAVVEKTKGLQKKTYTESPNVAAINTDMLLDMSNSNTEPSAHTQTEPILKTLDTAVQASPMASPTPPVQVSPPAQVCPPVQAGLKASPLVSASFPVQASPPEGDTGSICPNPDSEAESDAKTTSSSAKGSAPNIQEAQTSNATGDTSVAADDLTIIYEVRLSNGKQDFSDDSSWTTEEEEDWSIEEDDMTAETTAAFPIPEDCVIWKGETISNVCANETENPADPKTETVRPLDCVREIRELVVEVIEVEEVPQHYPDDEEQL